MDIYTEIIKETAVLGSIDSVGVVSGPGETAVCYSGAKTLQKYMDGSKKMSVLMQLTAMGENNKQEEIISRLCQTADALENSTPEIKGISQAEYSISSKPIPTMHDGNFWIYSMTIELIFYKKKGLIL